jgi:hypothetical protein
MFNLKSCLVMQIWGMISSAKINLVLELLFCKLQHICLQTVTHRSYISLRTDTVCARSGTGHTFVRVVAFVPAVPWQINKCHLYVPSLVFKIQKIIFKESQLGQMF